MSRKRSQFKRADSIDDYTERPHGRVRRQLQGVDEKPSTGWHHEGSSGHWWQDSTDEVVVEDADVDGEGELSAELSDLLTRLRKEK